MAKKTKPGKPADRGFRQKQTAVKQTGPALKERLDGWCRRKRSWIIAGIILFSFAFRIVYYHEVSQTHLFNEHHHTESDMCVFDEWGKDIAGGDLLSARYVQPEHIWMKWIANRYFSDNPDKLKEYQALAGTDTTKNTPRKELWTHWYGKNVFPHEPFYAYFLAVNYRIFGHRVSIIFLWQLLAGIFSNLLIYLIARRYFGDLAGLIAGMMAVFFGPMMFYEMVLLRSSLALFFGLLVTWLLGTALQKNKTAWWIAGGFATGISIMIHGYIVLFVLVWLLFLLIRFFREKRLLLLSAGGFSAGVLLAISPVMIRNSMVHAPVMSMSNNSAIGFISMNDKPFDNYLGWNVDFQYSSDIMAKSDGKLLKAIIPTLRTHDNVGGYIALLWEKLQATFGWFEIQNNVNYYFYRELNPVLKWTFLSFLLISPLAIAGLFLSFFRKLHAWPLYVMLLTFLAAMLGFMVLSRYRIVFAGILIPFAAFSVSEFFGSWNGRKNWIMLACIAVLIFWCAQPSEDKVSRINKNDYSFLWTIHYFPEISKEAKAQHFAKTEFMFRDFINRYEPGYIRNLKSYYHCRNKDEAEIFGFFADLHGNLGGLYNYVGQKNSGEREMEFANRLKKAAGQ